MACSLALAACAGSNPYGHGREYVPADGEDAYYDRAHDVSYEEIHRDPQGYAHELIGWFGSVTAIDKDKDGAVKVALDLRFHQPRHLCTDQFESSCRVTISERSGGPFSTRVQLTQEQRVGSERLNAGSLVRLYGEPTGEMDDRGGPMLKTEWFHYWPPGAYVTTSGSVSMR